MKRFITIALLIFLMENAFSQEEIHFEELPPDTVTVKHAEPVGGNKQLWSYLQTTISQGDTLGKKYSIDLVYVWFWVDEKGNVDSVRVGPPHAICPIHKVIATELKKTKWIPAKEKGIPHRSKESLFGYLYFNKNVLRKHGCR